MWQPRPDFMTETDEKRPRKPLWTALLSGIATGYVILLALYYTWG